MKKLKELSLYCFNILATYFVLFIFWWLVIDAFSIENTVTDRILKSFGQLLSAIIILEIQRKKGDAIAQSLKNELYGNFPKNIRISLATFCIVFLLFAFFVFLAFYFDDLGLEYINRDWEDTSETFFILWVISILVPVQIAIGEEIIFRGLILKKLDSNLHSTTIAAILNSILFAIAHLNFGFPVFILFVGSLLFAISYQKFCNIFIPIAIHFTYNFSIFWFSLYDEQGVYPRILARTDDLPIENIFGWYNIALSVTLLFIILATPRTLQQFQP